jgi:hypothetical protein
VFKIVFEVDAEKEDGKPFGVWSPNFTPTLNEKASFRKFLRSWFGRILRTAELEDYDPVAVSTQVGSRRRIEAQRDAQIPKGITNASESKCITL